MIPFGKYNGKTIKDGAPVFTYVKDKYQNLHQQNEGLIFQAPQLFFQYIQFHLLLYLQKIYLTYENSLRLYGKKNM